ncbi:MAG TPA: hypothetical protein VFM24_07560, partial [Nitrospira sp.]|nr:hypothetical protein [Nitrospira sp.]
SFLVCLEPGGSHRVVPAAFGAAKNREIFEDVHFAQRQCGWMRVKTAREAGVRVGDRRRIRGCGRRFGTGGAKRDRRYRHVMGEPARCACQSKLVLARDPPHRNTQRMHGPTLLKKRAASKHRFHDHQSFQSATITIAPTA